MIKRDLDEFALFGGPVLFDRPRPTGQIYSPDRKAFLGRLKQIIEARRFSNGGPFQLQLETRLAQLHGVRHVVSFANASFALIALLKHCAKPHADEVLLPSFTYRGLPHFIQWAGYRPRFCDVDLETHTLSGATVSASLEKRPAAAILAVNHVNAPAELSALERISRQTDTPVVYDSVYAIAGRYRDHPFGGNGVAEVFSLHATKLVNGFEGGYLTTNDDGLANEMRCFRNFGFDAVQPQVQHLGLNGKMNEIHAAMALTSLENLDEILQRNQYVYDQYQAGIAEIAGLSVELPAPAMVSNNEMVLMRVSENCPVSRDAILKVLQAENALARPYFSPPLHRSKNCPADLVVDPLPNTDALANMFIQLPTGAFLGDDDIQKIVQLLAVLVENGESAAKRFQQVSGKTS